MQRSNLFLIAAVAAGIVLMTIWRLGAEELPLPPDPARGNGGAVETPAAIDQAPSTAQPELPAGAPRVVVKVEPRERYVAPLLSRVQAVQLPQRSPLPTTMLAGTGANPWSDPEATPRDGVVLVAVEVDGGRAVRQVGVEANITAELEFGSSLAMRGTVRDAERKPLAGATVWLGQITAQGDPIETLTGSDGVFEARVVASAGVPLVVRAPGRATTSRLLTVNVDVEREVEVLMLEGGTLEVQLVAQADGVEAAQLFLRPTASRSTELVQYPFFWQTLFGGVRFDASGRAVVAGVPQRGQLHLTVAHSRAPIVVDKKVTLDGARTSCSVPITLGAAATGMILNDAGEALSGAELLVRPGGGRVLPSSGLLMLPPQLAARDCLYAESSGEGLYELVDVAEGVLAVRAAGHAGRDIPFRRQLPDTVMLPMWRGGELQLRVRPPVAGSVWQVQIDVGGGVDMVMPAGEDAVVALPYAGAYDLHVATWVGDQQRGERTYTGVAATGEVLLPTPKIE